jgi:hypothetical protein
MISATYHPAIYALNRKKLHALQIRLREQRSKTRTLARQRQREMRGKADQRGKNFPSSVEQPLKRNDDVCSSIESAQHFSMITDERVCLPPMLPSLAICMAQ